MHAHSLAHAIELQNAVAYGLTAGLYTQNPDDLAVWLDRVEAGNLYVNRGITGAIVQRQPFGGWKRSSVGAGTKAGGPELPDRPRARGAPSGGAASSATLHLRGLDSRISGVIEAAQPSLDYDAFEWLRRGALSDAIAWDREFGQVKDVSHLGVERNLFRYRPMPGSPCARRRDASWQSVLRVVVAGIRAGAPFDRQRARRAARGRAARRSATRASRVFVETDEEWIERSGAVAQARHATARSHGRRARGWSGRPSRSPRCTARSRRPSAATPTSRSTQRGHDRRAHRAAAVPARAVDHDHRAPLRQPRRMERVRHLTRATRIAANGCFRRLHSGRSPQLTDAARPGRERSYLSRLRGAGRQRWTGGTGRCSLIRDQTRRPSGGGSATPAAGGSAERPGDAPSSEIGIVNAATRPWMPMPNSVHSPLGSSPPSGMS